MDKLLKKNKQRKDKTPKWTSTKFKGIKGPMQSAAQIENTIVIKKFKNYTNNISM